jgi:hypothetical protein
MTIEQDFETVRTSIGGVSAEQQGQALAALSRIEAEVERLRAHDAEMTTQAVNFKQEVERLRAVLEEAKSALVVDGIAVRPDPADRRVRVAGGLLMHINDVLRGEGIPG